MSERLPGAQKKIDEYVARIQSGEDKEWVLQGLGPAFRDPIEERLIELNKEQRPSETTVQNYEISAPVTRPEASEDDKDKIAALEHDLGVHKNEISREEIEKRKQLSGWEASYELANVAKQKNVDLSSLSREEYVQFAIDNYLAIDDAQLRAPVWQRNATSVDEIVQKGKEFRSSISEEAEKTFARFSFDMMELAKKEQKDRYIKEGVRVLSGTKDSNSWLFFSINNGTNENELETHKSYFSLNDLNSFSPQQLVSFMETLQKRGYNGGVKIFQDLTEQGTRLNDQVVMHGFSKHDAELAIEVAHEVFQENVQHTSFGRDEIIDGKSKSYSQVLAEKIKTEILKK